ncbi:MAG: sulfurtransferase TusA family protein [Moraxella sp.]
MPLLKLKMALKKTALGHAVYVTATDPNSKRDIAAFCQHAGYALVQQTSITPSEKYNRHNLSLDHNQKLLNASYKKAGFKAY